MKKKHKEIKRVISCPLLRTPERGGGSVPLGLPGSCQADLRARGGWRLSPALRGGVRRGTLVGGCGSGHVAEAVGTGQGVCHTLHTSGPSRGTAGPSGPGQEAWQHMSVLRRGQMTFLPGLQLFSKPVSIALFHSFTMPSETNVARLLDFSQWYYNQSL